MRNFNETNGMFRFALATFVIATISFVTTGCGKQNEVTTTVAIESVAETETKSEVETEVPSSIIAETQISKSEIFDCITNFQYATTAILGNDIEAYSFRNDYGCFTMAGFSLFGPDGQEWFVDVSCRQFDALEDAQAEWENITNHNTEAYLKAYAARNGEPVIGFDTANVSYWYVDGNTYETCYSYIKDNMIVDVYGRVNDEERIPTSEEGEAMQEVIQFILDEFELQSEIATIVAR